MDEYEWDLYYFYSPFYVTQSIAYLFHPVSVSSNIFYDHCSPMGVGGKGGKEGGSICILSSPTFPFFFFFFLLLFSLFSSFYYSLFLKLDLGLQ